MVTGSYARWDPSSAHPSDVACTGPTFRLRQLTATFSVTSDDEYVHLSLISGRIELDLGARRHNYLLLVLARQRLRDARAGTPESGRGWLDLHRWSHDPTMCPSRLNLDVFRIRKQFSRYGIADAWNVIERRVPMRQIRLGTMDFHIVTI